ncbi:hypothetical protein [Occallatibacter savannae]|uniref:hypothetical protein n=1 Tax=Occallatibacter savannae TaxID=1002691 RepID=UPI000D687C93|nr:hypothetical protein [Occallatibacter savannae]
MKAFWLALLAVSLGIAAPAQQDAKVQVEFSNVALYPSNWTLLLRPDGTGHFHAEGGTRPTDYPETMFPGKIDRDVRLSSEFTARIFQTVHMDKILKNKCESHLKVAYQGTKKIHYSGPDGEGGCEFNYSTNKQIQELGESLIAVGQTLIEGARLEILYQHDPLGLDKAIQYVVEATGDGRMQEISTIRNILERLEDDPRVLDRVRKQARMLLARSGS